MPAARFGATRARASRGAGHPAHSGLANRNGATAGTQPGGQTRGQVGARRNRRLLAKASLRVAPPSPAVRPGRAGWRSSPAPAADGSLVVPPSSPVTSGNGRLRRASSELHPRVHRKRTASTRSGGDESRGHAGGHHPVTRSGSAARRRGRGPSWRTPEEPRPPPPPGNATECRGTHKLVGGGGVCPRAPRNPEPAAGRALGAVRCREMFWLAYRSPGLAPIPPRGRRPCATHVEHLGNGSTPPLGPPAP